MTSHDDAGGLGPDLPSFVGDRELTPPAVKRVMDDASGALRRCWEEHLHPSPGLSDRATVRFVIGGEGRVTSAVATDDTRADPEAVACLLDVMRGLVFPPPTRGPTTVTYPLRRAPAP